MVEGLWLVCGAVTAGSGEPRLPPVLLFVGYGGQHIVHELRQMISSVLAMRSDRSFEPRPIDAAYGGSVPFVFPSQVVVEGWNGGSGANV